MTGQSRDDSTRAWVEVDLGALRHNAAAIAGRAGVPLLPMVKADAYGLGAVPVARALEPLEPWGYGVATVVEGVELREAGIARHIVIFTPLLREEFAAARAARLTPVLGASVAIREWTRGGGAWHLGIDTGMGRAGARWDGVAALADLVRSAPPEGVCTHLHSAERNDGSRELQEERFRTAIAVLPPAPGPAPYIRHAENSAAIARSSRSRWSLARPGLFLYGVGSGPGAQLAPRAVVHLRARVVELRTLDDGETVSYAATYRAVGERRVATVPAGYADGYRRALSNCGVALVHGRRVPVVGLVTMDMTMLDVTDVPCDVGDVATLIGRDGEEALDVEAVACAGDLSPYELLTGLRSRLPRVYRERVP